MSSIKRNTLTQERDERTVMLLQNEMSVNANLERLRIDRSDDHEAAAPAWVKGSIYTFIGIGMVGLLVWMVMSLWGQSGPPLGMEKPASINDKVIADSVVTASAAPPSPASNTVLNTTGYVTARRLAIVSSRTTGQIVEILVEEGMSVERDQILARLDTDNAETRLKQRKTQLNGATANFKEVQSQLKEAELALRRSSDLAKKNMISRADLDSKQAKVTTLRARLAYREAEISVAKYNVELDQGELDDMVIRAPFSGVVVAKIAQIGEVVSPNSSGGTIRAGICTLVDMNSLEIQVDVNEAYLNRIKPSQKVEARLDAYPDWVIPAEVIGIIPTADRQKATVRVRIRFVEMDKRVLPDMGVRVSFLNEDTTL